MFKKRHLIRGLIYAQIIAGWYFQIGIVENDIIGAIKSLFIMSGIFIIPGAILSNSLENDEKKVAPNKKLILYVLIWNFIVAGFIFLPNNFIIYGMFPLLFLALVYWIFKK